MLKKIIIITISSIVLLTLAGCNKKDSAQTVGESVDKAVTAVSDTVNPKGPAEKVGRELDKATNTQ